MKIYTLLILCCIAVLFASCSRVYSPALYHQDIAYQPKPTSFDAAKSATYVSAGLNIHTNNNFTDGLVSGQVNLSEGQVFNNFNLAYGAFGVFGDYANSSINKGDPYYFTDKFFGAIGGRASANFFVTSGRADIRFIGVEAAYSHEFGSYADFRKLVLDKPGFNVDPRTDLFTIGLTSEVIFHNRNDNGFQHGIRGFLGTTFGNNALNNTFYTDNSIESRFFRNIFPKASYFIKFSNYFGTFEVGSAVFIRFGYKF
jgi:hypothetical protein